MSKIGCSGAIIVSLFLPMSAFAHGLGGWRSSAMSYYYPAPICWQPCPIYMPICPPPGPGSAAPAPPGGAPEPPLAAPTAAPPSAGPISPGKGQPEVSESRSFYESFGVQSPSTDKPPADRCALGFWNLTGRDLTVSVAGQAHIVLRGKTLKLQVGRQFAWRLEGHEPQNETVPMENSGVEIVLRRP
jgi:hypothetical protein